MKANYQEFTAEVIIAAYNNVEYTCATLNGFTRQSHRDFAITIADDGSGPAIHSLVNVFKNRLKIRHVWHEDKGFRKALILNKAIATSAADYIIFIDNDCIPHKDFIKDHLLCAQGKTCVTGRRVNLGPEISRKLTHDINYITKIENPFSLARMMLEKKINDGERGFHLPVSISNLLSRKKRGLLGSNMAIWRHDLIQINGFDSSFSGYGYEETDLQWRLQATGIRVQSIINRAIQLHLYHKQKKVTGINLQRMNEKKKVNMIISPHGINEAFKN